MTTILTNLKKQMRALEVEMVQALREAQEKGCADYEIFDIQHGYELKLVSMQRKLNAYKDAHEYGGFLRFARN